ncbi:hypothetical protein TrispH2_011652, partial [Trichoplax sp. H2]
IIINTVDGNQSKDLEETVNSSSWNKLCEKIQNCILDVPFFKQKIKLKWYIMAELFDNPILVSDRNISHTLDKQNSTGMQYIQTLEQVYTKATNRMEQSEIINVLKFLHGIGEIIFSQYSETDSLIVTELSWFYDNFRKISTLVDNYKQRRLASSSKSREYCKWARDYGIVTKASVKCAISHEALLEEDIDSLLQVMEQNRLIYKASRNLEDIKASTYEQYFLPYLLSLRKKETGNELKCGFQSSWLYLGYDKHSPLYITDQIFHQFLLSSQSELDVELYYHSAKYLPKHGNYTIIVGKSASHIRIQYCYEIIGEPKEDYQIKTKAISALSNDQLYVYFKTMLSKIVKDVCPERQEFDCGYFFPCLKCDQLMAYSSHVAARIIKCTNAKCRTKHKLANMKGWDSGIKSTSSDQVVTFSNPSKLSTCGKEDTLTSSADNAKTYSKAMRKINGEQYLPQSRIEDRRKREREEDENESDCETVADMPSMHNSREYSELMSPVSGIKRKRSKAASKQLDYTNVYVVEVTKKLNIHSVNRIAIKLCFTFYVLVFNITTVAKKKHVVALDSQSLPALSDNIRKVLWHYRQDFKSAEPYDHIKHFLLRMGILMPEDIDFMNGQQIKAERSAALLDILLGCSDRDIYKVCDLLARHSLNSLQKLGEKMKHMADEIKEKSRKIQECNIDVEKDQNLLPIQSLQVNLEYKIRKESDKQDEKRRECFEIIAELSPERS